MSLCQSRTAVKQNAGHLLAVTLPCRSWHCPECAPSRRRQLQAIARRGEPDTFLTLTAAPNSGETPAERARNLVRAFQLLMKRAKRKYGYAKIPFLAVMETTKRGEPHLHVLLRVKWLDQKWISEVMGELTGSPIVDIRRVTSQKHAAWYVSKYIAKEPERFEGCKRYWKSRDWCEEVVEVCGETFEITGDWSVTKKPLNDLAVEWSKQGWFVVWHGEHHIEAYGWLREARAGPPHTRR